MQNGRNLRIFWEKVFWSDEEIENINEGVLIINAPFEEKTIEDGFWDKLIIEFDLMFDYAEEEFIEYKKLPEILEKIIEISKEMYINNKIEYVNKDKNKMSVEKVIENITRIVEFLSDAYNKKEDIVILL